METASGKRLNKFISESGFCSRREADKLIEQSRVTINGKTPELGTKVMPNDKVCVDGKSINATPDNKSDRIYIAYNKPIGITCTTERHVRGNIIDAIKHKERIFPIGRLDKPSEGLIFLTSDGDIVNKILRAENAHDKEYIVTVDKPISERFITRMSKGVPILGTITDPCRVTMVSKFVFKIILTQGLNRQIRRMCEYLDYEVKKLKRVRIMNVDLAGLKPGQWRDLTKEELAEINQAVKGSRKTSAKAEAERAEPKSPKSSTARKQDSNPHNSQRNSSQRNSSQRNSTQRNSTQRTNTNDRAPKQTKPQVNKAAAKAKQSPKNKPRLKGKLSLNK